MAMQNDVFVISDEVFIGNSLSQKRHFPIAAVPGMLDQSITFSNITKMMGAPIRTSFCVGNEELVGVFAKLGGYPKIDQMVIAAALEDSKENQDFFEENRQKYLGNIALIKSKSAELNQKFCEIFDEEKLGEEAFAKPYIESPEAGNVYLLDFSGLRGKIYKGKKIESDVDVAQWLLNEASVGVVPGGCFMFEPEEILVRIALGHQPETLARAFDQMKLAAEKICNYPKEISVEVPGNIPAAIESTRLLEEEKEKTK